MRLSPNTEFARGARQSRSEIFEESPDSLKQRCRVTPGGGNPRESAAENRQPCMQGNGETAG